MKIFGVLVACLFGAALQSAEARPQYGGGVQPRPDPHRPSGGSGSSSNHNNNLQDGCRIEFKTVTDVTYVETTERVCEPYQRRQCDTKYRKKCTPYTEDECKTEYQQRCETKYKDECYDKFRDVPERYTEDECKDEYVRACEQHWVDIGNNEKVWEDDPSTCKNVPKTVCKPVEKVRTKQEAYRQCDKKPYQDCKRVPERKCYPVTKETCKNEPYENCYNVPDQRCEDVHKKIPQQTSKRQRIRVCDHNNHQGASINTNLDYDDYDYSSVFDERGGEAPAKLNPRKGINNEEDSEKGDEKDEAVKVVKNNNNKDVIVFG